MTDGAGYTFNLAFSFDVTDVAVDTQIDPPGTGAVKLTLSGSVTLTNTTDGHSYARAARGLTFVQLWPAASPVCTSYATPADVVALLPTITLLSPAGQYCALPIGVSAEPGSIPTLRPGASDTEHVVARQVIHPASTAITYGQPDDQQILDGIPEANLPGVRSQLQADPPVSLLLGSQSDTSSAVPTTCAQILTGFIGPVLASSVPITCAGS